MLGATLLTPGVTTVALTLPGDGKDLDFTTPRTPHPPDHDVAIAPALRSRLRQLITTGQPAAG